MIYIKRMIKAFMTTSVSALIFLLIMEWISYAVDGQVHAMTPEFLSHFPSETIAFGMDLLLYGVIGVAFSGMTFIYDIDKLGIVFQNLLYYLGTSIIWVPIVTFIWQLQNYSSAMWYTIGGFLITEIIMTIVGMRSTKADITAINHVLAAEKTP